MFFYMVVLAVPVLLHQTNEFFLYIALFYDLFAHLWILPFLVLVQFVPQILLLWRLRNDQGKFLDVPAFAADTLLFPLVGISWYGLRAGAKPVIPLRDGAALALVYSAEIWLDYVVLGLGQGAVLGRYLYLRRQYEQKSTVRERIGEERESGESGETAPLLGRRV